MLTDDYVHGERMPSGGEKLIAQVSSDFSFHCFLFLFLVNRQIQKTYFLPKFQRVERELDEERVVLCCDLSLTMRQEEGEGRSEDGGRRGAGEALTRVSIS